MDELDEERISYVVKKWKIPRNEAIRLLENHEQDNDSEHD